MPTFNPITTVDTVNDDTTVTRTTSSSIVYTADEYQALQAQLQNQVNDLQTKLTAVTANVAQVQTKLNLVR